ncbi:MAG: hypothetical protein ACRDDJ_15550, partial [[Mycobacterium] stephanolepidis]
VGASEIAVEGFAARETYRRVVTDAAPSEAEPPHRIVTTWPAKESGRGGGDAMARSSAHPSWLTTCWSPRSVSGGVSRQQEACSPGHDHLCQGG